MTVRITGHRLDRLKARPGQFFVWRFLTKGHWWTAHPFSLSELPGGTLRITVKDLGDHSGHMGHLKPGTRIIAEGPFGVFTSAVRSRNKVLLIAGGIGIAGLASGGLPNRAKELAHLVPMQRPGTAEEVAESVVWLLGDAASYVTGSLINVGGGR